MEYKNNIYCDNYRLAGHKFRKCNMPITSYGIIVFRRSKEQGIQYLMIRRKDSFGYIDFIRGKYSPYNIYQIQNILNDESFISKEAYNRYLELCLS